MSEILKILAADLEPGDVWLGGTPDFELAIESVKVGDERPTIPWTAGRKSPAIMMKTIVVEGVYHRTVHGSCIETTEQWTLQPDQPLEVRRDR